VVIQVWRARSRRKPRKDGDMYHIGKMTVNTAHVLGTGSRGTVVFSGVYEKRPVAVKRLVTPLFGRSSKSGEKSAAEQEISILIDSDHHPNVVRYFSQERDRDFTYLALEKCECSLLDLVEDGNCSQEQLLLLLHHMLLGLQHLHSLNIVHRDVKPGNILVVDQGKTGKIADMGLGKKLEIHRSSFDSLGTGSIGWTAPEVLLSEASLDTHSNSTNSNCNSNNHSSSQPRRKHHRDLLDSSDSSTTPGNSNNTQQHRLTKSVDIFSGGCVIFYTLTNGEHPFGDPRERELMIARGQKSLSALNLYCNVGAAFASPVLGSIRSKTFNTTNSPLSTNSSVSQCEVEELLTHMLAKEPGRRMTAAEAALHPLFWNNVRKLAFLQAASDAFDQIMPVCPALQSFFRCQVNTELILFFSGNSDRWADSATQCGEENCNVERDEECTDVSTEDQGQLQPLKRRRQRWEADGWGSVLSPQLLEAERNRRGYNKHTITDLLRLIRNKAHHFSELTPALQRELGPLPRVHQPGPDSKPVASLPAASPSVANTSSNFVTYFLSRFPMLLLYTYGVLCYVYDQERQADLKRHKLQSMNKPVAKHAATAVAPARSFSSSKQGSWRRKNPLNSKVQDRSGAGRNSPTVNPVAILEPVFVEYCSGLSEARLKQLRELVCLDKKTSPLDEARLVSSAV